jgi:hypothetical protein
VANDIGDGGRRVPLVGDGQAHPFVQACAVIYAFASAS